MSNHEVLVVEIVEVKKHPNADALEIVKVSGYDYSIISKMGEFKVGDLGVFVEPDYMVPTDHENFSFLKSGNRCKHRITVRKLRGIWSEGLLFKAPEGVAVGDNVMDRYGITRWEPPPSKSFGWGAEGAALKSGLQDPEPVIPGVHKIPHYGLENYKKHSNVIKEGEEVFYTTKIHGSSGRYVFWDGKMHCGSRTTWKKNTKGLKYSFTHPETGEVIERDAPACSWWDLLETNPWIEEWCKANPGIILYGEVFGCFKYKTPISLADGSSKMIGEIVNKKLPVKVATINLETKELEFKKVINWFKYPVRKEDFVKIEYEKRCHGGRGTGITVTKNHVLFDGNLKEKDAGSFSVGDELCFISEQNLNYLQEQMILGTLLGDSHFTKNYMLSFGHTEIQKDLVDIKNKILGKFGSKLTTIPETEKIIKGKVAVSKKQYRVVSKSFHGHSNIDFRKFCYSKNKKTVTKEWLNSLTPISLAFWYMDDGTLSVSEGKNNKSILCTNCFTVEEQNLIIDFFRKINIDCYYCEKRKNIIFSPNDSKKFQTLIAPYIIPSMRYKLNEEFRNIPCILNELIKSAESTNFGFVKTKIKKISKPTEIELKKIGKYMYDLGIEDNTNYFANKVLVHNSIVQGDLFHYGYKNGELGFRVFDVLKDNAWVPFSELVTNELYKGLNIVPVLYHGPHNKELLETLAEEPETSLPNCGDKHIREGIVIKGSYERWDESVGRVALKYVSRNYLMKS